MGFNLKDHELKKVKEFLKNSSLDVENLETFFTAFVHTSYANEQRQSGRTGIISNERLEFLGDAVVDLLVCDLLYRRYPEASEGDMARVKAAVASEKVLAMLARELNLGDYLFLGKGEEMSGGRGRDSILADAFEALIAAVYIERGLEYVKEKFESGFVRYIKKVLKGELLFDYKTALQELTQERYRVLPVYEVVGKNSEGFEVEVLVNGKPLGRGKGRSKKEAEKAAAEEAFKRLRGTEG